MIDYYNLDIQLLTTSEQAMLAMAKKKIMEKKPVLFYGWRPHSMFNKWDLKILDNKKYPGDAFHGSSIHVIIHSKLKEQAPAAYKFLSNWHISMDAMEKMITVIDQGKDADKVAEKWIKNHQKQVAKMTGQK